MSLSVFWSLSPDAIGRSVIVALPVDLVILTYFLAAFYVLYGKCSKILNTFLFLLLTKMIVIWAGIHK